MSPDEEKTCGCELDTVEWLDIGKRARDAGMVYLLITGGEPLLRPDFCEIYTAIAKMGVMVSVNTNGSLIDGKITECLSAHLPEMVNVTLYGSSENTYSRVCGCGAGFMAAREGILRLHQAGIPVTINTTFTRHNADDMKELVDFAVSHKIPIRTTGYIFPPVRRGAGGSDISALLTPEEHGALCAGFDRLTLDEQTRARRARLISECRDAVQNSAVPEATGHCMAGRGAFWITWDGKMLPCGMLPALNANARHGGFETAWESMRRMADSIEIPQKCRTCKNKPICPVCAAVCAAANDASKPPRALCSFIETYAGICNE